MQQTPGILQPTIQVDIRAVCQRASDRFGGSYIKRDISSRPITSKKKIFVVIDVFDEV